MRNGLLGLALMMGSGCAAKVPLAAAVQELSFIVGAWQIDGTFVGPDGDTTEFEARFTVRPQLGGAWLVGRGEIDGLEVWDVWGADPVGGGFVRDQFQSNGVRGHLTSGGFEGNTLTWSGHAVASAATIPVRSQQTRVDDDTIEVVWESEADGVWTVYSRETLSRHR